MSPDLLFKDPKRLLGLSIDTLEVVGGVKTRLFEGPKINREPLGNEQPKSQSHRCPFVGEPGESWFKNRWHWFRWVLFHLPGKPIYFSKRPPMASRFSHGPIASGFGQGVTASFQWMRSRRRVPSEPQRGGGMSKNGCCLCSGRRTPSPSTGSYCGWMKSVSHHFETMVETMVFTGVSSFQGLVGGAKWISQPFAVA